MGCGKMGLQRFAGLLVAAVLTATMLVLVPGALGVSGAISTTDDPGFALTNPATDPATNAATCLNGHGVNCNIYTDKWDVFLSGLPVSASLGAGTYFFAVLVPGGQHDPNDGSADNLSDTTLAPYAGGTNADGSTIPSGDPVANRTFTVDGQGNITYGGSHDWDQANNKIDLFPFDDTTNPGGVYIAAVCQVANGPVDPSSCKYDAFKVNADGGTVVPPAGDLSVTKTAIPSFTREYNWTIKKTVDACQVTTGTPNGCSITGSTKTLNYKVVATKDAGTDSNWQVTGQIEVSNPNLFDVSGVTVTDQVTNGGTCVVTGGTDITIPAGQPVDLSYACTWTSAPSPLAGSNTATATWPDIGSPDTSASNNPAVAFDFGATTPNLVHDSVSLSDLYSTTPSPLPAGFGASATGGTVPSGTISSSTTFNYAYTVTVPHGCVQLNNTATFTVSDTDGDADDTGSSAVVAKVCRTPAITGALTMGFWQNPNGQKIISGANQTLLGTWLKAFHPFSDAPSSNVAGYVTTIIKAATCGGSTCNAMLRAQMLSTALDVYFSDPALGGNKIGAYSGLGSGQPAVGAVSIDLTQVCAMIDGSSSTCSGSYENASSEFGGSPKTVLQMLQYSNTADPAVDKGANWYAQVKTTQVVAKDAFDAINNGVAFQSA